MVLNYNTMFYRTVMERVWCIGNVLNHGTALLFHWYKWRWINHTVPHYCCCTFLSSLGTSFANNFSNSILPDSFWYRCSAVLVQPNGCQLESEREKQGNAFFQHHPGTVWTWDEYLRGDAVAQGGPGIAEVMVRRVFARQRRVVFLP